MSIQRITNSIWGIVATNGTVMKVATQPYLPASSGSATSANNQAMAAVNGDSPFITVTRDGLAVNAKGDPSTGAAGVTTSLADFSSSAGIKLDENSGKYHVVRQYGDIYLFNDGNIISWGGNGKNFGFGNGYEESHAWASGPYVYNNETFTIPPKAMSLPELFTTAPDPSPTENNPDYEWLGGAVSKSWGVEFTYSYGTTYEWSSGPDTYIDAYGNAGKDLPELKKGNHCTYSYGTGYEEALIEWTPTSAWVHADDSNSPYAGRLSDSWTSSNLGPSWKAQNLLVSKAFGPTYDYHFGPAMSVQEGPSEEHVNGASWSTVKGDSTENVTGNSTSTVNGNSDETVNGNATAKTVGNKTETYWGNSDEYFMGGKNEMMLGGCDEINLAAKLEIVGGGALEMFLGAKMEMMLGPSMEIRLGPKLEIESSEAVGMSPGEVKAVLGAKIDAVGDKIVLALINMLI